MARPRKPTETLKAQGAFQKNPQRTRKDAATRGPLGAPPASLPPEMHATWLEIAEDAPIGVLTRADRPMFEMLVFLQYTFRLHMTGAAKWNGRQAALLATLYTRCGMTPSDRSKVRGAEAEESDENAKYFN
jgi:hypothetical protein